MPSTGRGRVRCRWSQRHAFPCHRELARRWIKHAYAKAFASACSVLRNSYTRHERITNATFTRSTRKLYALLPISISCMYFTNAWAFITCSWSVLYITVAYIWSHDLHTNTGVSKNHGIRSLQYRYAKKKRYRPPLLVNVGSLHTTQSPGNQVIHRVHNTSAVRQLMYGKQVIAWFPPSCKLLEHSVTCWPYLISVMFHVYIIFSSLVVRTLTGLWIRVGCPVPVYELQCVVMTSISDIKSACKWVCDSCSLVVRTLTGLKLG